MELIVQADAHGLITCCRAIASSVAIIQSDANDVELIAEGCVEGRKRRSRDADRNGCDPDCFGAQIDKLIFDLGTPMLIKQPFDPASRGPACPYCG